MVKNPPVNAGDTRNTGLTPGLGRPPGVGNGNPLLYFTWDIPWTEELVGYSSWSCKESDTTEQLSTLTRATEFISFGLNGFMFQSRRGCWLGPW